MSDTPEIRPALTDEEWGVHIESGNNFVTEYWAELIIRARPTTEDERSHALAALCLHDHPAGFGWEDVEMLRGMVNGWSADRLPGYGVPLQSLADRIASLLPPKEE